MAEIDKVIQALECHSGDGGCIQCPYNSTDVQLDATCAAQLCRDAKEILEFFKNRQKPVAPETIPSSNGLGFACGVCGAVLWVQKDTGSLEQNKQEFRFCHRCGTPVKWEEA